MDIIRGVEVYPQNKEKLYYRLRGFLEYFSVVHNIEIDFNHTFPPILFKEKYERLLEILKYLQEGPKTRHEIAGHFNISERNLSYDLSELQSGDYSFLGYEMQIDLKRGKNTYSSTIHPIFLPLNLSEVYALTIGLKLIGKNTVYNDIFDYISESIYSQLSEYGQRVISERGNEVDINFESHINKEYRYEPDNKDKYLKEKRAQMIAYYLKSGAICKIEYNTDNGTQTIKGILNYAKDDKGNYDFKKLIVTGEDKKETNIDISKIIILDFVKI